MSRPYERACCTCALDHELNIVVKSDTIRHDDLATDKTIQKTDRAERKDLTMALLQRSLRVVVRAVRGTRRLAEYPGKSFNRGGVTRGPESGPAATGTGSWALLAM